MGRSLPPKRSHAATPEPLSSGASDRTLVAVSDANDTRANPYRRRQIVGTNESRCDVDHVCGYHTSAATRFLGPRSCRCLARRSDCAADPRQPDRPVPALRIAGTRRHQAVMAGAGWLVFDQTLGILLRADHRRSDEYRAPVRGAWHRDHRRARCKRRDRSDAGWVVVPASFSPVAQTGGAG